MIANISAMRTMKMFTRRIHLRSDLGDFSMQTEEGIYTKKKRVNNWVIIVRVESNL